MYYMKKKNKINTFIIFTLLVIITTFSAVSFTHAQSTNQTLPDNVKITTSPDGSSTTVFINAKPGFSTNVQTNCINGKCTNTASSKELSTQDIQNMQDMFKKQQEEMNQFWKMQNDLFNQQQKMFQDLWGIPWF